MKPSASKSEIKTKEYWGHDFSVKKTESTPPFNLVGDFYQFGDAGDNFFPKKIQKFICSMKIVESMNEKGEPRHEMILAIRPDKLDDTFGGPTKSLENKELEGILDAAGRHNLKCSSDTNEILSGTIKFEICSQSKLEEFLEDKDFSECMYFSRGQLRELHEKASGLSLKLTNPHDEGKFFGSESKISEILDDITFSGVAPEGPSSTDAAASKKTPSLGSSGGNYSFYGGRPPSPTASSSSSSSSGAEGLVVTPPGS